jgi:hypothetical protein
MMKIAYPLTTDSYSGDSVFNWIDSRYAWLERHYGLPSSSRSDRAGLIGWNSIGPINGMLRNTASGKSITISYEAVQVLRNAKSLFFSHQASLECAEWVDNEYFAYQLLHYRSALFTNQHYFEAYFDVYSDVDAVMMKLALS